MPEAKQGNNHADLWKEWYETASRMWSRMLVDPYGLYRYWFDLMERSRDRVEEGVGAGSMPGMGGVPGPDGTEVRESMKRWMDKSAETYRETASASLDALKLAPRWMQMMEEVRENLMKAESLPADPMAAMLQWYNATSGPFSRFLEDVIQREEFLEASSRFFEHYTSAYKVMRRTSEEYWRNLQLPTRSDIARVASLVIALEDKVDRMEEELETEAAGSGRMEDMERRIERVEQKLDRLLAAVERLESSNGGEIRATEAARRRAAELGVDLREVRGTGAEGQITVEDVRRKGES